MMKEEDRIAISDAGRRLVIQKFGPEMFQKTLLHACHDHLDQILKLRPKSKRI